MSSDQFEQYLAVGRKAIGDAIAGGAAGVKHGRHVVLEAKQTPLANLWLTLLQGVGIETDSFGDSTGTLGELTA